MTEDGDHTVYLEVPIKNKWR